MSEPEKDLYLAYGHKPASSRGAGRVQSIINLSGALGSAAFVVFLAWWGWDLAMRDARGVPVVRAIEGPMRIAPSDPGGRVVNHQGLSVNDIAAVGSVTEPLDRVLLAPAPIELTLEDLPGLEAATLTPVASAPAVVADAPREIPVEQPAPIEVAEAPVENDLAEDPVARALAEALGLSAEEVAQAQPQRVAGSLSRSLRPRARPAGAASPEAVIATSAVVPAPPSEVSLDSLSVGTRLVQFGAYESDEMARAQWATLSSRFPSLMANKSMVIQTAESGGQTFWRLRAHGFENEQESRRFCAAFEAEGARCIPVAHR